MNILAEADYFRLFMGGLMVLLIIGILIGAVGLVRRAMFSDEVVPDETGAGFTLGSLRQLVRDGKMTQEEFEKAKAQIVEATQRAAERKAPVADPAAEYKTRPDEPH